MGLSENNSYPTLTKVKGKIVWKCCYGDIECIKESYNVFLKNEELYHFVTVICPNCIHYRGEDK